MVTASQSVRDGDSARTTQLYWLGVLLVVAGLFVTDLLPCVDYPQHLALSDIARRLSNPLAREHGEYELNFFTYNGLFHLVVSRALAWLPIELAGRLTVAGSLIALAAAVEQLVRILRRPLEHAALFTPVLFSFSLAWGFVNYAFAIAIAAWALVFVARVALRPSYLTAAAVGALGMACAYAHVLAMLLLCLMATALAVEVGWRASQKRKKGTRLVWSTLLRAAIALVPLSLGCVYCIAVYQRQYVWAPAMYRDPTLEGTAPPLWEKVAMFSAFASDLFGDATDQVVLWVAIGVMGWATILRAWVFCRARGLLGIRDAVHLETPQAREASTSRDASPAIVAPFVVTLIAYLATPMVFIGTHLIFPRLGQMVILTAMLAMPRFPVPVAGRARGYALRLGIVAGVNLFAHCALYGWETRDASAILDEMPAGRSVTALVQDSGTVAFRNGTLTHLAAYYAARKHGEWAFAFARYLSVPVRFKEGSQPPWPAKGWEFNAADYDPRCGYARAFPVVLIRATEDLPTDGTAEQVLRRRFFKADANAVRLVAHRGEFWAFDTVGLPSDGTY